MIEVFDSIESSRFPLGFCVDRKGSRDSVFSGQEGKTVLKVEARALGAHQKEAVVTEGELGPKWRMVSDEGPQLKGSDLAPFPLGFFNAGLQADLLGNIDHLNQAAGSPLSSVQQTLVNRYTFSGSFFAGTGQGQAEPAEIEIHTKGGCSLDQAAALVSGAVRNALGLAAMSCAMDCTFEHSTRGGLEVFFERCGATHAGRQALFKVKHPLTLTGPTACAFGRQGIAATEHHWRWCLRVAKSDGCCVHFDDNLLHLRDLRLRRKTAYLQSLCRQSTARQRQSSDETLHLIHP